MSTKLRPLPRVCDVFRSVKLERLDNLVVKFGRCSRFILAKTVRFFAFDFYHMLVETQLCSIGNPRI